MKYGQTAFRLDKVIDVHIQVFSMKFPCCFPYFFRFAALSAIDFVLGFGGRPGFL